MDQSPISPAKPKLTTYRASIIYQGKHSGKSECLFIKAISGEEAHKFAIGALKKIGVEKDVKVDILASSKTEIDFYRENLYKMGYTGVMN